ncbi:MAG: peptidoglycan DD-metalloendopeptidase family protein [Clostridia bacterium]|nr:peptidoglycan DD-metalloendopeptidase family protein [Clostridia bacterium]
MKKLIAVGGLIFILGILFLLPKNEPEIKLIDTYKEWHKLQAIQDSELEMKQMLVAYDEMGYEHVAVYNTISQNVLQTKEALSNLAFKGYILTIGNQSYTLKSTDEIVEILQSIYNDVASLYNATVKVEITPSLTVFTNFEKTEDSNLVAIDMVENVTIEKKEVIYASLNTVDQILTDLTVPDACVVLESNYEAVVPKDLTVINDPEQYLGAQTTVDNGQDGIKAVTTRTVVLNDEVISKEVISEEIIKAPENQIVSRGTGGIVATEVLETMKLPVTDYLLTSEFGIRWNREHKGVDLAVSVGTPVHAAADGIVTVSKYQGEYGNLIEIDHGDGIVTRYAHNSVLKVSVGDVVSQGDLIAMSGNTGKSTGPHVHFELILNGTWVNPLIYAK